MFYSSYYLELKKFERSPYHQAKIAEEHALELVILDNIRHQNEIEHEKWLQYERKVEKKWLEQNRRLSEKAKIKEAERKRIQDEFEAEQKHREKLAEEKRQRAEELKQLQADLHRRINEFAYGDGETPCELREEAETNPGKELCPFFIKMAACRFGNKCAKNHVRPKISPILMVPSFFTSIRLDNATINEYGSELTLEYDETEMEGDFHEFFEDVLPEFQKFGRIEHFVASQNYERHLRGHVYVEYDDERYELAFEKKINVFPEILLS